MHVVWHAIDCNHFLFLVADNASDIVVEFLFVFFSERVLASLHCVDDLDINLGVGVCHKLIGDDQYMPLLRSSRSFKESYPVYKHCAPSGASTTGNADFLKEV